MRMGECKGSREELRRLPRLLVGISTGGGGGGLNVLKPSMNYSQTTCSTVDTVNHHNIPLSSLLDC